MRNLIWSMEKWKSAAKTAYSGNIVGYVWSISHSVWLQGSPTLNQHRYNPLICNNITQVIS